MFHDNHDRDVSLNKSIKMWKNIPVDGRLVTSSLNELDDKIHFPYIGMIFYSEFEDKYYKVLSTEDGYRIGRTGKIVRKQADYNPGPYDIVPGYFVGEYIEYVNGGGGEGRTIRSTNIDNEGYLHVIYSDGVDDNVGKVVGDIGPIGPIGPQGEDGPWIEFQVDDRVPYPYIQYRPVEQDPPAEWLDLMSTELLKGQKGDTGETGDIGPQGPAGADGQDGQDGEAIVLKAENDHLYYRYENDDPEDPQSWVDIYDLSELRGATGPQGPAGADGQDGQDGQDGREIELRKGETHIQWKYTTEGENDWRNLVSLADITGADGQDGEDGQDGTDGREIELRKGDTHIQWKYTTEGANDWRNLISIADITGPAGQDGSDGEDGNGIANVEVTVDNHLYITYTNGDTTDAGVINVSGAEQTIDADVNQVIVGDGNDWAQGTNAYVDVIDFIEEPAVPSEYAPESQQISKGYNETRLAIDLDNESELSTKQIMITNQTVKGKTAEELTNEDKTSYSYNNRRYKSNYSHLILKNGAKVIAGGDTEVDLTGDNVVRMHGGMVEIDDQYGRCNPYFSVRGNASIMMEGMYTNSTTKTVNQYSGAIQCYIKKEDLDDPDTPPTIDEIMNAVNGFVYYNYSTHANVDDTYGTSTNGFAMDKNGATYLNELKEESNFVYKFNHAYNQPSVFVFSGNVYPEGTAIPCYYCSFNYTCGEIYTKSISGGTNYTRHQSSGSSYHFEDIYSNQVSLPGNLFRTTNAKYECLLMMKHKAVIDMMHGAVLNMKGTSYIAMQDDSHIEMYDYAGLHMTDNSVICTTNKSVIDIDDLNTISLMSGRPTSDTAQIPVCIEWDGNAFNVGPVAIGGTYSDLINSNYISLVHSSQGATEDCDLSYKSRAVASTRLQYAESGAALCSYFRSSSETFTKEEIEDKVASLGYYFDRYLFDPTSKPYINNSIWLRGHIVSLPENTESIIEKIKAKRSLNTGRDGDIALVPKVGKIKEAYELVYNKSSYYVDGFSVYGWFRNNYINSIMNITGWEDVLDMLVVFRTDWDTPTDVMTNYSSYGITSTEINNYIYILPIKVSMYGAMDTYYPKFVAVSTTDSAKFSSIAMEDGVIIDTQLPSRMTNTQLNSFTGNYKSAGYTSATSYFDQCFTEVDTDQYSPNPDIIRTFFEEYCTPTIQIKNDSIVNIGGQASSRSYIQIGGKAGESINLLISGNTYLQHTGDSHSEMHDKSRSIMRGALADNKYPWNDIYEYTTGKNTTTYWHKWTRPVQVTEDSPNFGMYDASFIHMSGTWITDTEQTQTTAITFTSTTTQDPTTGLDAQAISDLNAVLYTEAKNYANYVSGGTVTASGESGNYTITINNFKFKYVGPEWWSRYATKIAGNPVLELTQDADVRVREKAKVFMHDEPEVNIDGKARVRLHDYATIEMDCGHNPTAKYPGNDMSEGIQQTIFRMHGKTRFNMDDRFFDEFKKFYWLYILKSDIDHMPTIEELKAHEKSQLIRVYSENPKGLEGSSYQKNEGHPTSSFLNDPTFTIETSYPGSSNVQSKTLTIGIKSYLTNNSEPYYIISGDTAPECVFNIADTYCLLVSIKGTNDFLFDPPRWSGYEPGSYAPSLDSHHNSYLEMTGRSVATLTNAAWLKMEGPSSLVIQGNSNVKVTNRSTLLMEDAPLVRFGDVSNLSLEGAGTIYMRTKNNGYSDYNHRGFMDYEYPILDMTGEYFHFGPQDKNYISNSTQGAGYDRKLDDRVLSNVYAKTGYLTYGLRHMPSGYFSKKDAVHYLYDYGIRDNYYSVTLDIMTGNSFIDESTMSNTYVTTNIVGKTEYEEYKVLLPKQGQIYNAYTALVGHESWYDTDITYITHDHIQDVKDTLSNWSNYFFETYMVFVQYCYSYYQPSTDSRYYTTTPVGDKLKSILTNSTFQTWIKEKFLFTAYQPSLHFDSTMMSMYNYVNAHESNVSRQLHELSIDGTTQMISSIHYNGSYQWYYYLVNDGTTQRSYSINNPLIYFYNYDENLGYTKGYGVTKYLEDNPKPATTTPVIEIKQSARIKMCGSSNESIQILDIANRDGEKVELHFNNNAFVQYAENSHSEMWNASRFIMRSGNRGYRNVPGLSNRIFDSDDYTWASPVAKVADNPYIGVYDGSGFQMTGVITDTDAPIANKNFTFTSTTTTDPSVSLDQQALDDLEAYALSTRYQKLEGITYMSHTGESGNYTITVQADKCYYMGPEGWNRHLVKDNGSPILELSENAEVRIYQNFSIKADNEGIEFSSGAGADFKSVHFTVDELIRLKALLN